MMHEGEQVGKNLSISIENPDVLNIPQCTHDIHPDVLMVSPDVLNTHYTGWECVFMCHSILERHSYLIED